MPYPYCDLPYTNHTITSAKCQSPHNLGCKNRIELSLYTFKRQLKTHMALPARASVLVAVVSRTYCCPALLWVRRRLQTFRLDSTYSTQQSVYFQFWHHTRWPNLATVFLICLYYVMVLCCFFYCCLIAFVAQFGFNFFRIMLKLININAINISEVIYFCVTQNANFQSISLSTQWRSNTLLTLTPAEVFIPKCIATCHGSTT